MLFNQSQDGTPAKYRTVKDIATQYIQEIRTVQAEGPYCLAGYSFGGLVAYEMAQQLLQQGQTIAFLGLVDPTSPSSTDSVSPVSEKLKHIATTKPSFGETRLDRLYGRSRTLWSIIFTALRWRLTRLSTMNTWNNRFKNIGCKVYFALDRPLPPSLRNFYRTRFNQQVARQYVPQKYCGKISIFQSSARSQTSWGKLCSNDIESYYLPGKHLEIVEEPNVKALFTTFMDCLRAAQTRNGGTCAR